MPPKRKRTGGRQPGPNGARTLVVPIKLSEREHAAIVEAVARENAEIAADTSATAEDRQPATVSSWIRDHALEPLSMATYRSDE